jgi:hypothetical protein
MKEARKVADNKTICRLCKANKRHNENDQQNIFVTFSPKCFKIKCLKEIFNIDRRKIVRRQELPLQEIIIDAS